jgi:serine/threonine protein kinase
MNATEDRSPSASAVDDDQVVRAVQEYLALVEAGQKPDRLAFANRYPDIARALAECLAGLDFVHAAVPELSGAGPGRALASLDAPDAPQNGTVGDFRIIREVGRGGMGIVYEAEQISLGRRVALKILPFAATMDPRHLQRFQNEARAAASLEHPHIVPVHGVGCERGIHYYAMRFIDGQTLAALVEQQRVGTDSEQSAPDAAIGKEKAAGETAAVAAARTERAPRDAAYFRRVAEWGAQAALAIEHSHAVGVVHRDIKPANLMIDAQGKLWVTDFGLAQIHDDKQLTLTGDMVGTLRYMSPEQALAKRVIVDHRTDIYSLGATLYELLTLEPVFTGGDREELLRQIAFEEPKPLRRHNKSIPAELETILFKALEKNAADRYATARELAEDLDRLVKNEPIQARPVGRLRRLAKWIRRRRALAAAYGLAVLTLALTGLSGGIAWLCIRLKRTAARRSKPVTMPSQRVRVRNSHCKRRPGRKSERSPHPTCSACTWPRAPGWKRTYCEPGRCWRAVRPNSGPGSGTMCIGYATRNC